MDTPKQLTRADVQAASQFVRYGIAPENPLPFDFFVEWGGPDQLVFTQVSLAARAWYWVRLPYPSRDTSARFSVLLKHAGRAIADMKAAGLKVVLHVEP
jgi:hypothetical protein